MPPSRDDPGISDESSLLRVLLRKWSVIKNGRERPTSDSLMDSNFENSFVEGEIAVEELQQLFPTLKIARLRAGLVRREGFAIERRPDEAPPDCSRPDSHVVIGPPTPTERGLYERAARNMGPEGRRDLVLAYAAMNGRSSTWLFHEAVPRMWRPMRSDGVLGRGRAALYVLHEFVVMPDHLHLLLTPAPEVSLERAVQINQGRFFLSAWKRKTRIGLAGKLHKPSDSRRAGLYALRGVHSHESGPCAAGGNTTVVSVFVSGLWKSGHLWPRRGVLVLNCWL